MRNKKMNIYLKTTPLLFSLIALLGGVSLNAGIVQSKSKKKEIFLKDISQGKTDNVKAFLEKNTYIQFNEDFWFAPFKCAIDAGNLEIVELLVSKCSNDVFYENCGDLLRYAAQRDQLNIVKFLIEKGAYYTDYPSDMSYGVLKSPYLYAIENANFEMLKLLDEPDKGALKLILSMYPNAPVKFKNYFGYIKNYYEDGMIVTKKSLDQNGQLIDPELIPNYFTLSVAGKDIIGMNSVDITPDFDLKKYIITKQRSERDKMIVKELIWIYLKNNPTEISVDDSIVDKITWKEVAKKHTLFRNNKIQQKLPDTHFLFVKE